MRKISSLLVILVVLAIFTGVAVAAQSVEDLQQENVKLEANFGGVVELSGISRSESTVNILTAFPRIFPSINNLVFGQ